MPQLKTDKFRNSIRELGRLCGIESHYGLELANCACGKYGTIGTARINGRPEQRDGSRYRAFGLDENLAAKPPNSLFNS